MPRGGGGHDGRVRENKNFAREKTEQCNLKAIGKVVLEICKHRQSKGASKSCCEGKIDSKRKHIKKSNGKIAFAKLVCLNRARATTAGAEG